MASLSPLLTATPTTPPTYSVGMAETFSWIPVEGAGRPLYARATYLANASDIQLNLSGLNIEQLNLNTDEVEGLIEETNTLLNVLTAKQGTDVTFLESQLTVLTAVNFATKDQQELIVTLLDALTAKDNTTNVSGVESKLD